MSVLNIFGDFLDTIDKANELGTAWGSGYTSIDSYQRQTDYQNDVNLKQLENAFTASQNSLDREQQLTLERLKQNNTNQQNALDRALQQELQNQKLAQELYLTTNAKSLEYQDLKNAGLNPSLMYGTTDTSGNFRAPAIAQSENGLPNTANKKVNNKMILHTALQEAVLKEAVKELAKFAKQKVSKMNVYNAKQYINKINKIIG